MAVPLVSFRLIGGIATLRLDDPEHRNVLSHDLSESLAEAVAAALAAEARVVVLTAAAPVFCAGGSLEGLLNPTHPLREMYAGFQALSTCPVPTIAAVGGPALGAGVNLPLACDVVIASTSARFDPRFLDVGIHPGGGHLWHLIARIGAQGAAALSLFGDALTGEEAAASGLAWRCVADADLDATVQRLARRVVSRADALVRRTKESLIATRGLGTPAEAAALELAAQEWSVNQPGFAIAVQRVRDSLERKRR